MNKIINLTPHDINILDKDDRPVVVYPRSGKEARVKEAAVPDGSLDGKTTSYRVTYGDVVQIDKASQEETPLPEPATGVLYAVSTMTFSASGRRDFIVPYNEVRNEKGHIIGVRGFRVR